MSGEGRGRGDGELVAEVVARALELPAEARAGFIREQARGDAEVESEALSLVEADLEAGGFLSEPTFGGAGWAVARAGSEAPGTVIGPYVLVREIGEGGFGSVFLAQQEKPVKREVALKVLKLGMDTRAVVARFEAERRTLALMEHPSIARVLDAGATESGRPYFVMELVRGESIVKYCDERGLSCVERLQLFVDVCLAVQHAHTKGVIHRDLKPSNILVAEVDGRALAKVIDFGIAKATGPLLSERTFITEDKHLVGTPVYMSPEQADDAGADVDTRSDIYSLGVLLYELLAGVTPYSAEELRSAGWTGMRRMIREVDPPRPSARVVGGGAGCEEMASRRSTQAGKLAALLRGDLDSIVMQCLEKDPARRYQTAEALAMDIGRHLSGDPVLAVPARLGYRAAKLYRRNRAAVIAVGAIGVGLSGGLTAAVIGLAQARSGRAAAEVQADRAQRIADFLRTTIEGISPGVAMGRDTKLLLGLMEDAKRRIEAGQLADNPEAELELRITIGGAYDQLGDNAAAVAMLEPALALAERLWEGDHPLKAECLDKLVSAIGGGDDSSWVKAEPIVRRTLEMRRRLYPGDHPAVADSINDQGWVWTALHRWEEAEALYREALAMRQRLYPGDHSDIALSLHNIGALLNDRGRFAEAEGPLRESLAMTERVHPPEHPAIATGRYSLAGVLAKTNKLEESEALYRRVMETRDALYSGDNILTAQVRYQLAGVLIQQERTAEAVRLLAEGRAMWVRMGRSTNTWDVQLFQCYMVEGRAGEAESLARELLAQVRSEAEPKPAAIAAAMHRLAIALLSADKLEECEGLLKECLTIRREVFTKPSSDVALTHVTLAECLERQGRREEALAHAREAKEIAGRAAMMTPRARERIEAVLASLEGGGVGESEGQGKGAREGTK